MEEAEALSERNFHLHSGPFELPGTGYAAFNSEHVNRVRQVTGVNFAVRKRKNWDSRKLVLNGPAKGIDQAYTMAMQIILKSQENQPKDVKKEHEEKDDDKKVDWKDNKKWSYHGQNRGGWSGKPWSSWSSSGGYIWALYRTLYVGRGI